MCLENKIEQRILFKKKNVFVIDLFTYKSLQFQWYRNSSCLCTKYLKACILVYSVVFYCTGRFRVNRADKNQTATQWLQNKSVPAS